MLPCIVKKESQVIQLSKIMKYEIALKQWLTCLTLPCLSGSIWSSAPSSNRSWGKSMLFRSVQLPVLPDLESSTELPAKGQVGPDPPCPFYFFDQASCARNQSAWVVLKPQTNQNASISRKTSILHKNRHLSRSRKFSFATSAWLRAAMLLERAKSQSQQSCENVTLWKRWHLFRDKNTRTSSTLLFPSPVQRPNLEERRWPKMLDRWEAKDFFQICKR